MLCFSSQHLMSVCRVSKTWKDVDSTANDDGLQEEKKTKKNPPQNKQKTNKKTQPKKPHPKPPKTTPKELYLI